MNKHVVNEILKRHGYEWRKTTPEDASRGPNGEYMHPTPHWLICHDLEDGEEILVIAYTHSGGKSLERTLQYTEKDAIHLAEKLLQLEAKAKETGGQVVQVTEDVRL